MKDADLKRNASGYYDETAYKAITAPPKAGEIWASQDGKKHWLILQNHGDVCSTLLLGYEQKADSIMVMGRVPMYTTPVMVGYTFSCYATTFIKSVPADKMTEVKKAVGEALGIESVESSEAQEDLKKEIEYLTQEMHKARKRAADLQADLDTKILADRMVSDSVEQMEQEITRLNVFKEMYMDLIDKLVSVRGGAIND